MDRNKKYIRNNTKSLVSNNLKHRNENVWAITAKTHPTLDVAKTERERSKKGRRRRDETNAIDNGAVLTIQRYQHVVK